LTFSFWLTGAATIEIKLFDVTGDDVAWLSKPCRAGENRIEWRIPRKTANGVYIYTLEVIPETDAPVKKRKFRGKFAVLR